MAGKVTLLFLLVSLVAPAAWAQTRLAGTSVCGKPESQQALQVGDRPGHSFAISQGKCNWTKPAEIGGVETKDDVVTLMEEISGNRARSRGFGVGTMANGDKFFVRIHGTVVMKEGMVQSSDGQLSFVGGTGKLAGLKGKGTYKGTGGPDGVSYQIEGEYEMAK